MQHCCKYRGCTKKNGMRGGDYLLCGSTRSIMGDKFTSPLQLQIQLPTPTSNPNPTSNST